MQQNSYTNNVLNAPQRVIILTEFILQENLEEQYLSYLKRLNGNDDWSDFRPVIKETISEYQITHHEIQQAISDLVSVPVFC